jgi:uncharacterized membrane protein
MARDSPRAQRLDTPIEPRRVLPRPHYDPEAFGRLSERIARFLGTGRFLVYMTAFVAVWIVWNVLGPADLRWDPYAFIFLTLILSLQASYAAPLILLAQNRQADRDRVNLEQDREVNQRARADMEYLAREVAGLRIAIGEVATRDFLRSELRALLDELEERQTTEAAEPAQSEPGDGDRPPRRASATYE